MKAAFHSNNRDALVRTLGGGLVVLAGYKAVQSSKDIAAAFRQEASFWYLAGVDEPGWRVIIDGHSGKTTLVRPELSEVQRIFDGEADDEAMLGLSGADEIIAEKDFELYLRKLARRHAMVYEIYDQTDYGFSSNPAQKELHDVLSRCFPSVQSCQKEIHAQRAIKQPEEIRAIKQAVRLTIDTFREVKQAFAEFCYEYEIEAAFDYAFKKTNSTHAYEAIVAAGKNACTLHYVKNSARLAKNQLVLMDIGASVGGYAADITRTYQHGAATKRQRQVHRAVVEAHQQIISLLKPNLPVEEYMRQVDAIMKEALAQIGLLKDVADDDTYRRYFPHAISHGLGIDVHDSLGAPRYFQPGMVLTVEPGIYIPEEGIGVRIEDDILISASGHTNLSAGLSTDL